MRLRRPTICTGCGAKRPRNYHCIECNSVGRGRKLIFEFRVGWRRPEFGEFEDVPLHERELITEPVDPRFSER